MLAAFLTTICFSFSVLFASRSAKVLGSQAANLSRITLALVLLAIWSHTMGAGCCGPAFWWFFLSGVIGFGFGDISLFATITRVGPRLAILLTQCLGAPIAAVVEWAWLGTRLRPVELGCAAIILAGVAMALAPDHGWEGERKTFWMGVLFGVCSALGQALGAVISRKAYGVEEQAGFAIDGWSAAYQRIIGGVLLSWLAIWATRSADRKKPTREDWKRAGPLVVGNALAGPVIGVGCFQWALQTTASGIVLPIVATSPLVTMVLSFFIDHLRPRKRAVIGGILAVTGLILLKRAQTSSW